MFRPTLLNITVPVFNRPELTRLALLGIRKTRVPFPYVLTVVDNGSGRETVDVLLRLKAEGVIDKLLLCRSNFGVSLAANLGWRLTDADLYLKLDNDILVQDPDWLQSVMARWAEADPVSTIAPAWKEHQYAQGEIIMTRSGELSRCPTNLAGAAILVPRTVSDVLGHWIEDYGLYGAEDGDYGVRMRLAGFSQYYYRSEGMLTHAGDAPDEATYLDAGIDKQAHMDALHAKRAGLSPFELNASFYALGIRSLRVPLKFDLVDVDAGFKAVIRVRPGYIQFRKGLRLCGDLFLKLCSGGGCLKVTASTVRRLRDILVEHGDNPLAPVAEGESRLSG